VIDVGCGATTIEFARRVAPGGEVLGPDISTPMLERARERAPADLAARYALADATICEFAPRAADLVVSRFGVAAARKVWRRSRGEAGHSRDDKKSVIIGNYPTSS